MTHQEKCLSTRWLYRNSIENKSCVERGFNKISVYIINKRFNFHRWNLKNCESKRLKKKTHHLIRILEDKIVALKLEKDHCMDGKWCIKMKNAESNKVLGFARHSNDSFFPQKKKKKIECIEAIAFVSLKLSSFLFLFWSSSPFNVTFDRIESS